MLRRTTNQVLLAVTLDLFFIAVAAYIAMWLRLHLPFGRPLYSNFGMNTLLIEAFIFYPVIFFLFSLYDPEKTFHAVDEFQILSVSNFIAALALAGLVFFTERGISRLYLLYFYGVYFILIVSWRGIFRAVWFNKNIGGLEPRRVLLIGGGEVARQAIDKLESLSWAGVHLVGYLTDGEPIPSANGHIQRLGKLISTPRIVQQFRVDDVLIALPAEEYSHIQELVAQLIDKPCNIWVMPDYFSLLIYGSRVENLGGVPMISLKTPTLTGYHRVVKRAFDLLVGGFLLILALPILGFIALAIRLDSSGPALLKQRRVGENGRLFWMYKFRSMVEDAEQRLHEVIRRTSEGQIIHKLPDDPRITRVGSFIRRTSLDELPQLFNVLLGEMSLVGPRPELPILVAQYKPWQQKRFAVPQGMTGWWQVNGRSDKPMHLNTEDDLFYVQNFSLLLDIQIMLKTVSVVLKGKGAF